MHHWSLIRTRCIYTFLPLIVLWTLISAELAGAQVILEAHFDSNADGFVYADDIFRSTNEPAYASGDYEPADGLTGGGLKANVGAVDDDTILDMSGGFERTFTLAAPTAVEVALNFNLRISSEYEADEFGEALLSVDGVLYGLSGNDYLARVVGDGNGGSDISTGWLPATITTPVLAAGSHTVAIGTYNNKKTLANEETDVRIDDVTVTAIQTTCVQVQVSSSSDDAEEEIGTGEVTLNSTDLELGDGDSNMFVGMRFTNVSIPQGAEIVQAYLTFQVDEVTTATTNVRFIGEDVNNAATFTTVDGSIGGRFATRAMVPWFDVPPWNTIGDQFQTPDLSPIIQEIVDRPGWSSGNALVIIEGGTGIRTAESFDGVASAAPILTIKYSDCGGLDCNNNGVGDDCELFGNDCNNNGVPDECDTDCNNNGTPDDCESITDCNNTGIPDECELAGNDCNNNGVPDECDVAGADCDNNGVPDDCQPDCDNDGLPDACEVDCNSNGTPDDCEGLTDCNGNGTPDECETFPDCNGNSIPDECEPDCNGDGTPDACEADCNSNGTPDECEALPDCNGNGTPDECESFADCNNNGIPDECDPDCNSDGTPDACEADCNSNGTPDECEALPDCNGNGTPDECESFADCNNNGIPDECDPDCDSDGTPDTCEADCNNNGTPDDCEGLTDCNSNGTPDVCETLTDCNSNGTPDVCEAFADCNGNSVPDECDPDCDGNNMPDDCEPLTDCNSNSVPDQCDVIDGTSMDTNGNGIPDECENDCNSNGTADADDISNGTSEDCNFNSVPDECDTGSGASNDVNGNDIPDECEGLATTYCQTSPNSVDPIGGVMSFSGSLSIAANNLTLHADPVPNTSGLFFFGTTPTIVPFGQGFLCVGGVQFRLVPAVPAVGNQASRLLDFTGTGNESLIIPGDTRYFQYWYRDPTGLPNDPIFNTSDGLAILFPLKHSMRAYLIPAAVFVCASLTFAQDECASATAISGTGMFPWSGSATAGADPVCVGNEDEDLWFAWTVSQSGTYRIATCDSDPSMGQEDDTLLGIYASCADAATGACLATGNDDCAPPGGGPVRLSETTIDCALVGETYLIRVSEWSLPGGDADTLLPGVLTISLVSAITPNNDCLDAIELAPCGGVVEFCRAGATYSGLDSPCGTGLNDVWYKITPPTSGFLLAETCGNGFETRISMRDSCGGVVLSCNDDATFGPCVGGPESLLFANVIAGTTYYLQISFEGNTGTGSFSFLPPTPPNDECVNAEQILGTGFFPFDNSCATNSGVDAGASCTGTLGVNADQIPDDVWFVWTVPADGCFLISTCNQSPLVDTKLAVYDGADCRSSTILACNDDAGSTCSNFTSQVVLTDATAGTDYLIQVGTWAGANSGAGPFSQGAGMLDISAAPVGTYNYCASGTNGVTLSMASDSSLSVATNDFRLIAATVPDTFGLFYFGPQQFASPFGGGTRCVGGGIFRLQPAVLPTSPGMAERAIDFTVAPSDVIAPGSCWNFQYWFRDQTIPDGFDLSNALTVIFDV